MTNFALFASNAERVNICFCTEEDLLRGSVSHEVELDPLINQTGDVWHIAFQSLDSNLLYTYRVFGSKEDGSASAAGLRYAPVRCSEHKLIETKHINASHLLWSSARN